MKKSTHLFDSSSSFCTATITNMLVLYHKLVYQIRHRLYHLPHNRSRPLFQCHKLGYDEIFVFIWKKNFLLRMITTPATIYPCNILAQTRFFNIHFKKLSAVIFRFRLWERTSVVYFSKTFSINSTFEYFVFVWVTKVYVLKIR